MRLQASEPSLRDLEACFPLLLGNGEARGSRHDGPEKATSYNYEAETSPTLRRKSGILDFLFGV